MLLFIKLPNTKICTDYYIGYQLKGSLTNLWYIIHGTVHQGSLLEIFLTVGLGHLSISVLAAPFKRLDVQLNVVALVPNKLNGNTMEFLNFNNIV